MGLEKQKMDFKSFVNKENFKAILLQHLKRHVKTKFGPSISDSIQKCIQSHPSDVVTSVSDSILQSKEYPEFLSSFLGNVSVLLEDQDSYVAKPSIRGNQSQCSSASSVNASSIDFLSPEQFQNVVQCLNSGTNAEKLESLGTLYRLPTLEHITHHVLWSDLENGLHSSLSSNVDFLKHEALKLYVKMLSCSEPKVVLESYLSLIKYFLQNLLPIMNWNEIDESNFVNQCASAIEIVAILNKFLQNISSHWLRYPQSLIENITVESLSILSPNCNKNSNFPIWTCTAVYDPEAKWLKSLIHGHVSRAAFLGALEKDPNILHFAVNFCESFASTEEAMFSNEDCCKKSQLFSETTHVICFLSHLLQYCEGRQILDALLEPRLSCWVDVLCILMNCIRKLYQNACFSCCAIAGNVVSRNWNHVWNTSTEIGELIKILACLTEKEHLNVNYLDFLTQCLSRSLENHSNLVLSLDSCSIMESFILELLHRFVDLHESCDLSDGPIYNILWNSSLKLVKNLLMPSPLFLNIDFIEVLTKWWLKISSFSETKCLMNGSTDAALVLELEQNILDVSIRLLGKQFGITLCYETSLFETNLNILLEKILKDIKLKNSVCPCDVSMLSSSLNSALTLKSVLNKTAVFRLSSIIWQLKEEFNGIETLQLQKYFLETVLPSIFCELCSIEITTDVNPSAEFNLFGFVLLFPNLDGEICAQEDYYILSLQVISLLSSSIHALCVLQVKFRLAELLLELQCLHVSVEGKQIIDPISILINHIFVKLHIFGGPSERSLPCDTLENIGDDYNWPFIKEYPIPEVFYFVKESNDVTDITFDIDEPQNSDFRGIFLICLQQGGAFPLSLLTYCLNSPNVLQSGLVYQKTLKIVTLDDDFAALHDEELAVLDTIERYGRNLGLISNDNEDKLEELLKASKCLLTSQSGNRLDIFVCTVYLICRGDSQSAWAFLSNFSKTSNSIFIWRQLLEQASQNYPRRNTNVWHLILELIDLIVKKTLPLLFSALQLQGISPSVIYNYWTMQCYWNFLDFSEISHFVLLSVIYPGDFSLYFFVSVLKHLQGFIMKNAHNAELYSLLIKNPIVGFKVSGHMAFMNELSDSFHDLVTKALFQSFD